MILYAVCSFNLEEEFVMIHTMCSTLEKAHEYGKEEIGKYFITEFVEGKTINCYDEEIEFE